MIAVSKDSNLRLSPRSILAIAAAALGCTVVGCSGSSTIQESQLTIVATEAATSFSRSSQGVIGELALTPVLLANPPELERVTSLLAIPASSRALLISEAWYLRAQNDIEVPIATSLDRYLRSAHYSYDALFTDTSCKDSSTRGCGELLSAYNRATREIARLTNNGLQIPRSDGATYVLQGRSDGDILNPAEWELTFNDLPNPQASQAFGPSGAACQVITADDSGDESYLRRCTPIAFVVTFARRADDGRARAEFATYPTLEVRALTLHDSEITLSHEESEPWMQLLGVSATPSSLAAEAGCLAPTESTLPTVIFALPFAPSDYNWAAIASTLSSDPYMHERFNFCVYNASAPQAGSVSSARVGKALSALSPSPALRPTVIVVAQGAQGEDLLRHLKESLRDQRGPGSSPELVLAGSLVIPTPRHPTRSESGVTPNSTELSQLDQPPLHDIKRFLTRLSDSEDGILSGTRRGSAAPTSGMNLSPVM